MMSQFSVTFVRHGETELNCLGVLQGQGMNPRLNEQGREQAQALGRHLSSEVFTHVYSSDLIRALETCELLLAENSAYKGQYTGEKLPAKEIVSDKRLRERSFGVMEGKSCGELGIVARAAGSSYWEYTPEGGETMEEMENRGVSFFNSLCDECYQLLKGEDVYINVLVVMHGGLMATMMSCFSDKYGCRFPRGSVGAVALNTGRSCFDVRFKRQYSVPQDGASSTAPDKNENSYRKVHMVCTKLNNYDHLSTLRF